MHTKPKLIRLIFLSVLLVAFLSAGNTLASPDKSQSDKHPEKAKALTLEEILAQLNKTTKSLKSLELDIEYTFIQDPELFESKTCNRGKIYYKKGDKNRSKLRLSFQTRQEDDFEPEKYREEFIFDGCWLTRINYPLKQVNMDQFAEHDKPIEVFELISANLPLIGFSHTENLKKDFDIKVISQQKDRPIHLEMKVLKDSKYFEKYKKVDFYIDPKIFLPVRIVSKTPEDDIYDIKFAFTKESIDKILEDAIFTVETPEGFDKNINKLEKKDSPKNEDER